MDRRKLLWILVASLIAFATFRIVLSQAGGLRAADLFELIRTASPFWLCVSVLCMLSFILTEGLTFVVILNCFGYPRSVFKGVGYSSADIFFSAITPSASGGQPASMLLMGLDRIPGGIGTACLILNLVLYTAASAAIGVFCIALKPGVFLSFGPISKALILCGIVTLVGLSLFSWALMKKGDFLARVGISFFAFLKRIGLIKNFHKWVGRIKRMKEDYMGCAGKIKGNGLALALGFIFDLLQRIAQITVTLTTHLALKGSPSVNGLDLWIVQAFSQIGSSWVPIPGGMGAADYLMIDGFGKLLPEDYTFKLQILSRGLSFYICTLLAGLIMLFTFLSVRAKALGEKRR